MNKIIVPSKIHRRFRHWIKCILLTTGVIFCLTGCNIAWRPSLEHVEQHPQTKEFTLTDYLEANRIGYWAYQRRDLPANEDRPGITYARRAATNRFSEGELLNTPFLPLSRYIQPSGVQTTQPVSQDIPVARFPEGMAIYVELEKPLPVIPHDLQPETPMSDTTAIRYYDYRGKVQAKGKLTREVSFEGFEDIECTAGNFERCMRIRVDLNTRFSWILSVTWSSYLWLSPTVGEVRRVHAFSGAWFFIFRFHSAHEYLLVNHYRFADESIKEVDLSPKWKQIAMVFDRGIPRPSFTGMAVDYCTSQPAP
ncbi:MAG: hypothetical protein ACYTF1_18410 [Planctomycetota bacterium]|jgi:hypothetical protein